MQPSFTRKWLKNLIRVLNLTLAMIISLIFYYQLHKILGFSAVVLGSVVVIITPAFINLKLISKTKG
jgi:uncharacterized membrane protein YgaE (UPF0421/DUF939 family)